MYEEFLSTFETQVGPQDGAVSLKEWVEYYTNVSASIDDDEYFAVMMNNAWNLNKQAPAYQQQPRHWSNQEAQKAFNTRPRNHGHSKHYSGSESRQLNVHQSSAYHQDREAPIRKSLAYSPSRQLTFVETPGETTNPLSFGRTQPVYELHNLQTKAPVEYPSALPQQAASKQRELLVQRMRSALAARGVRGLVGLKRQFKVTDSDNSGALCLREFQQAIDDLKVPNICESELHMLFKAFDRNGDDQISCAEFLNALVGELSPDRARLVEEAFASLDANQSGSLDLDEVKARFDPARHPDVKARLKTVEEARFEFFNLFTNLHSTNKNFTNDREVTLHDFLEYHQYLST